MEILKTKDMELHEITKTHPIMSAEQYEAFKADIATYGQLQPVLTYRGRIVDGRHRLRALTELGIDTIKTERLPNNLTMDQVRVAVYSTEMRRHQTPTMLAVKAYRLCTTGMTQPEAAKKVGTNVRGIQRVASIVKMGRLDIVELLEVGEKFNISKNPSVPMLSDSLPAIINRLQEMKTDGEAMMNRILGVEVEESEETKIPKEQVILVNSLSAAASVLDIRAKKMLVAKLYEGMEEDA